MELRQPPRPTERRRPDALVWLLTVQILILLGLGALVLWRGVGEPAAASGANLREVASQLRAAGALAESARVLDEYLSRNPVVEGRANMAYTLGQTYLDLGQGEQALRWFYEAEGEAAGALREEVGRKIVHSLERLGRFHAARAALDSRVQLAGGGAPSEDGVRRSPADPVVARIGEREILRSEVERALDDLPPQLAQSLTTADQRGRFLRQFVAEELLWGKARKLEYDQDPEVKRQLEQVWRQLAMTRFVEQEVLPHIDVDESDLRNFFTANRERYAQPDAEEPPDFEQLRGVVERDYRQQKLQAEYQKLLDSQLASEEVEVFADRMADGD